ncbi:MAG: S8 family peptidase [Elusimicrobia bacterium]|nr:S8 family peptidase [Elusimicrobiota bacterium]
MRKWLWFLGLLALAWPVRGDAALTAEGAQDRLIVAFKPAVGFLEKQRILEAEGLEIVDEIPALGLILAQAPEGRSFAIKSRLFADPRIAAVERDVWRKWIEAQPASFQEIAMPSVESVLGQLPPRKMRASDSDEVQWGVRRVNAPAAWASNRGDGVRVAIVDTGIDPEHPELKDKIAGGYNALDKSAPWADDHFHGTHVAGIVAAKLDGQGVVGVAPKASLYAVKVLNKEGSGSLFGIIGGIMWCAQNNIQVINMSLGAPQEMPFMQQVLQFAQRAGVTIVAAAGNDSKAVNYPAAYPEAIAVSALDQEDKIATFSSRGPEVAFIAPGVKVPSSVPRWHEASGIKAYSGTSMATPHVTGLAALAVAKGASTPEAVRAMLKASALRIPNLGDSEQGAGVIDGGRLAR